MKERASIILYHKRKEQRFETEIKGLHFRQRYALISVQNLKDINVRVEKHASIYSDWQAQLFLRK